MKETKMKSKHNEFHSQIHVPNEQQSNINYKNRISYQSFEVDKLRSQDFDTEEKTTELSLMEELSLIALGEERAYIPILNDKFPYVLRGCIMLELVLAHRIQIEIGPSFLSSEPYKANVTVTNRVPTGDVFLDEALNLIAKESFSLEKWIYILSGDTWSQKLSSFQMHNLRERICKSLIEKGIVSTQKSSFFLIETTEYPILNPMIKRAVCFKMIDLVSDLEPTSLRSLCRIISMNSAKILYKALRVSDAPTCSKVKKFASDSQRKFAQLFELELEYGHLYSKAELILVSGIFSMYNKFDKYF